MTVRADLHVHSCLSPCGDLRSSPSAIAAAAREAGLQMLALTDHNTAENAPAFATACRREGVVPVFGAEATSSEEAHVLGLFADSGSAVEFGRRLYGTLPAAQFDPARYGDQVVVDDQEIIVETLDRLLIGASTYSLSELGRLIHELGGLFVPAHIDRTMFSVWSQLGFLPPGPYDAVERTAESGRIDTGDLVVVSNSDAHVPEHIARRFFSFEADEPTFAELARALATGSVTTYGLRPAAL